jgi:hypothetical protein
MRYQKQISRGGAATFLDGETRMTITRSFLTAEYIFYFLYDDFDEERPRGTTGSYG